MRFAGWPHVQLVFGNQSRRVGDITACNQLIDPIGEYRVRVCKEGLRSVLAVEIEELGQVLKEQRIEKQKLARQQRDTEDKLKRWSEQELDRREKSPQKPRGRDKGREVVKPSSAPAKPVRDDPAASQPLKSPWESDVLSNDKDRPAWESDLFKPPKPKL